MIEWPRYAIGEHRIECPNCGRGGRDKTAGLTIKADGKGVLHCFRCEHVESHHPERGAQPRVARIRSAHKPQMQKHERLSDRGQRLWSSCRPLGGIALQYLQNRRCVIPPEDGDLRWHPSLKHPSGYTGPALVALITDVLTKEPLSLHRTWITPTGKAKVAPPRLLLGNHQIKDGAIRLWPDEAVTTGLGLAEGIESALSLAHAMQPVWSTIDAGHLRAFPVLPGVECLTIAVDADLAGYKASSACGYRWREAGAEVRLLEPNEGDANDLVRGVG